MRLTKGGIYAKTHLIVVDDDAPSTVGRNNLHYESGYCVGASADLMDGDYRRTISRSGVRLSNYKLPWYLVKEFVSLPELT